MKKTSIFDKELKQVSDIKFLPWVGSDYNNLNGKKLLIVGESDYHRDDDTTIESSRTRDVTLHNITENISGKRPYYDNIEKVLFGRSDLQNSEKLKLWNSCAYYNLCQKIVTTKPDYIDFNSGWNTLFKVLSILKPDYCIITSLTTAKFYGKGDIAENPENFQHHNWQRDKWGTISGLKPGKVLMTNNNGYKVPILFTKHPSSHFSWKKWHDEFIVQEMRSYCNWLSQ